MKDKNWQIVQIKDRWVVTNVSMKDSIIVGSLDAALEYIEGNR